MVIQDITQRGRLIKLHTPLGRDALLAERAEIEERISPIEPVGSAGPLTGFKAVVHAVSTNAHIELKALIGQPALLELQTAQGAMRPFHGHITQATNLGSDNGLNAYQIVFEPWLSVLAQRQDSWVFQGQTVMQIIDEVFADYQAQGRLMPAWRWDLQDTAAYPQRSLCAQYQETDLAFVERLLREEGLFYWFEHSGNPDDAATLGQHTLVIADHNGAFAPNAQERIRFTQSSAVLPEDSLNLWDEDVSLEVAGIHLASMDDRTLSARPVSTSSQSQGMALAAELHIADVPGAYAYEDAAQGERLALRQMQAFDALRYQAHAQGTVRSSAPGTTFTLLDHFAHDGTDPIEDQFVMLSVRHTARSNVSSGISASLQQLISGVVSNAPDNTVQANDTDEPVYQCALTVQRADVPVRAAGSGLNLRPTIDGNQTAIVVGLDEPVHTDRDHRIKVQFHWQRGLQSGHRLDHPAGSNAPATEAAWTWVRVAERIAGANWGANFTPRLGQEVLVQFIGSDIDRPVVVGSLYNGRGQADAQGNQVAGGAASSTGDAQPWFPGNGHAAVMSGIKTQELASSASGFGGYNQLTLDDTPDANRIEASTTQSGAQTWLQLGHLLQQQDNQRLKPRGHGIDLGSAAWGAVRAGSGLILSAHGRQPSVAGTQQIDPREPKAQLAQANALVHKMAESAQAHKAMTGAEVKVQGATKQDKAKQLAVEQGFFASDDALAATESQGTSGSNAGAQTPGGVGTISAWSRPDLVMAAPGGVFHATPANAIWSAGNTASLVASGDINQMAQANHATSAKDGVVLFTYGKATDASRPNTETGIKLHAASGSVHSQSQSGATRLTADKAISVSSTTNAVKVGSPSKVLLTAAGAAIRLEGGNITLNGPGSVTFKAGMKVLTGPASASPSVKSFPRYSTVLGPTNFSRKLDFEFTKGKQQIEHAHYSEPLEFFVLAKDSENILHHKLLNKNSKTTSERFYTEASEAAKTIMIYDHPVNFEQNLQQTASNIVFDELELLNELMNGVM